MSTFAAIAPAALNFAGSLLGGKGGVSNKSLEAAKYRDLYWAKRSANELPRSIVQGWQKSGIHPLAGIGVPLTTGGVSTHSGGEENNMGQNLARAAASAIQGRADKQLEELTIERAKLENDLLRSQLTTVTRQPGDAPNPVNQEPNPALVDQYSYKGENVGVALGEMGEVSQAYMDITTTIPKIAKAQGKQAVRDWVQKNKSTLNKVNSSKLSKGIKQILQWANVSWAN